MYQWVLLYPYTETTMDATYTMIITGWLVLSITFWIAERIVRNRTKSNWSVIFFLLNGVMVFGILIFVVIPRAGLRVQDVLIPLCLVVLLAVAITLIIQRRRHNGRSH
jgi:hypothetical protein